MHKDFVDLIEKYMGMVKISKDMFDEMREEIIKILSAQINVRLKPQPNCIALLT